ncbi:uncharacterized protein RCO7_07024 [Rhynchosporium graminicola]|uniref:Rhodopsin domain-containing protein n=1 Tax=Rhynchosporium graminicola TaxID=2792576 RepID=A0A1E1K0D8_9HELO|nr:uncharacterized protein RCO7_07024 [Rhynchosporium commune]
MSSTFSQAVAVATRAAVVPKLSPEEFAARAAESNLPFILGMIIPFFVLAFLAVMARMYVRFMVVKVMGIDDYIMLAAMACSCVAMGIFCWQTPHSLGRHQNTVSVADMITHRKANLIYSTVGAVLGLHLVKISICFLLMRFVNGRVYRIALWSIVIFLVLFTVACWGTLVFWCLPVRAFWDVSLRRLPSTYCYPIDQFTNVSLINTSFNIATDVLLASLPVHVIWNLQINHRQKVSLIGVLSLGYAAVALGVVKAIKQVQLLTDNDATWSQSVQMWGYVQLNVSIIASCMPALRPLFSWLSDAVSSNHRSRATGAQVNTRSGYFRQYDTSGTGQRTNVASGMRSFGGGDMESDVPLRDIKSGNTAFVSASASPNSGADKSWIDIEGDSGSEKEILPNGQHQGQTGIVRTTEVTVKSDNRKDWNAV